MIVLEKHIVPAGDYHIRIQEYAGGVFKKLQSRSAVKKCIAKKGLYLDGTPAQTSDWIKEGQLIELVATETQLKKVFQLQLEVIYEDEHLALVNKPAGFPTNGNYFKTIENALPFNLKESTLKDALNYPTPVHRLDNPTSGILIIAKTKAAQIDLHQQFEKKEIQKTYHAIVAGKIPINGIINFPIENLNSLTEFKTIKQVASLQNNFLSLVQLYPKTGRTHQLRIHLSKLGFPIVGDKLYAPDNVMKHKGLFLCASSIDFTHPDNNRKLSFSIPIPNKFNNYLTREKKRYLKHIQ